jgi:Pyruvate/2-oxoacid:ferredoxin oxidoreductase gamma subunit
MVALGAYIATSEIVTLEEIISAMDKVIPERLKKHIPANITAIRRGMELVRA